ncbi:hypothetical protein KKD62_02415 [Patescibacteria group bacterium]|nr:hypothetical protein [Patescibacteria group bacterium]MBU1931722.1 hypothetical protein [Patescibacteria group bacterium]
MKQEKIIKSFSLPRAYMLPLLVGALIISLTLLVLRPQISNIIKLRKEVVVRQERLTKLIEKLSLLQGTSRPEVKRRVEKIESVFPSEKPAVQIINTVSQLAEEKGLGFSGLNLAPGELSPNKNKTAEGKKSSKSRLGASFLEADFTVEGLQEDVFEFLNSLERAAPIMKIDALSLTLKSSQLASADPDWLEATINVSIFYKLPPEELGKIDTPLPLLSPEEIEAIAELDGFRLFTAFNEAQEPGGRENPFEL